MIKIIGIILLTSFIISNFSSNIIVRSIIDFTNVSSHAIKNYSNDLHEHAMSEK